MKLFSAFLSLTLIFNQTIAFAKSTDVALAMATLDLSFKTESQIDQSLTMAAKVDAEEANSSPRKARIEHRWLKRLNKVTPRVLSKIDHQIDQMDASADHAKLKQMSRENLNQMIPQISHAIAEHGGVFGYLVHLKSEIRKEQTALKTKGLSSVDRSIASSKTTNRLLWIAFIVGVILLVIGLSSSLGGLAVLGFGIIFVDFLAFCAQPGSECVIVGIGSTGASF